MTLHWITLQMCSTLGVRNRNGPRARHPRPRTPPPGQQPGGAARPALPPDPGSRRLDRREEQKSVAHISVGVLGTGSYLPKEEVGNEDLAARVGVDPEWIIRKTLIRNRRFAAPDEATSDLAAKASVAALAQAGTNAADIDYLIVTTSTGDHPLPPTSYLVQDLLGAHRAACFDINVTCSSFVYALALARGLLLTRPEARVLIASADLYSRSLDFSNRRTAILLGDGVGAAVVGAVPDRYGVIDFELRSRGDAHRLIRIEAGGTRSPITHDAITSGDHLFRMEGRAVREFVIDEVPPAVATLLSRTGTAPQEVRHFIPHQPNGVLLTDLDQRLGLPNARLHRTYTDFGNLGSASVPVTLDRANRAGDLADGDLLLLAGFGGGMSIGACLLRWAAPHAPAGEVGR
ncbi:ketoacyl-ACP synthase III [Micromonospora sp. B11E3]|uniref:3-oxoacyl-ACP synthase III family protein n=1 Tax=Micromonospora sp. B11E3 TaxID=3153562 RepID=UPI00325CBAD1